MPHKQVKRQLGGLMAAVMIVSMPEVTTIVAIMMVIAILVRLVIIKSKIDRTVIIASMGLIISVRLMTTMIVM